MTSSESPTSGNRLSGGLTLVPVMAGALLMGVSSGWFAGVAGCAPLLTSPDATVWLLLLGVTPVLEEYLLRQAVHQPLIGAACGRPWSRCLLAGAVFAALHLGRGLVMPAQVFLPAVLNGWLFERTRRWQLCAVVHALANLTALLACSR